MGSFLRNVRFMILIPSALILLFVWFFISSQYEKHLHEGQVAQHAAQLAHQATALNNVIQKRFALLEGLYAFALAHPNKEQLDLHFATFASALATGTSGIRNFGLAPDGVISYVDPLAGNEKVIGHDLIDDPRPNVRADVQRALKTRQITLSGPYLLRQGGLGLVARKAVFRGDRFWGLTTMVLDLPPAFVEAELNSLQALPGVGLRSADGEIFYGSRQAFTANSISYRLDLPDGFWEIGILPSEVLASPQRKQYDLFNMFFLVAAGLLLSLIYTIANRQCYLAQKVKEQTLELEQDLAERKRTTRQISDQQELLERSQELGHVGTWELDTTSNHLVWTDECYRIFGVPLGSPMDYALFLQKIHPEDLEYVQREWQAALQDGGSYDIEHRLVGAGGTTWVRERADLIFDGQGNVVKAIGFCQDISDRKQAEESLRKSEEKFRALADTSPLAIYMSSGIEQKAEYINPAFTKLFGYSMEEVPSVAHWWPLAYPDENYRQLIMQEWQEKVEHAIETSSEIEPMDVVVACKDGSLKHISWGFSAVGKQNWALGLDLTERKQAEKKREALEGQVRQTQKMEAIGTLAGGIAHDFNNLLAIIIGNLAIIQRKQATQIPAEKNLEHIKGAVQRATDLVKQILAFSRQEPPEFVPVDLNTAIKDALKLLRSTMPATIEILNTLDNTRVVINGDSTQLQQIFINLCTNALQAMDEKGLLRVNLEVVALSAKDIPHGSDLQAGRYARLSVCDTGPGMDMQTLDKIFDPFFTTKPTGHGTGMGLSVTHGIVVQHGGFISVDSEPGLGSTFNVYFPMAEKTGVIAKKGSAGLSPSGTERILVVDDEETLAAICCELLDGQGYRTTSATSSVDALDIFRANPQKFDLVITDQTMPEMSGAELSSKLLEIRPELPIILCSGYSAKVSAEEAKALGIRAFCMKPVDAEELAVAVRQVLDERGSFK